jgi:hypothetical protein
MRLYVLFIRQREAVHAQQCLEQRQRLLPSPEVKTPFWSRRWPRQRRASKRPSMQNGKGKKRKPARRKPGLSEDIQNGMDIAAHRANPEISLERHVKSRVVELGLGGGGWTSAPRSTSIPSSGSCCATAPRPKQRFGRAMMILRVMWILPEAAPNLIRLPSALLQGR